MLHLNIPPPPNDIKRTLAKGKWFLGELANRFSIPWSVIIAQPMVEWLRVASRFTGPSSPRCPRRARAWWYPTLAKRRRRMWRAEGKWLPKTSRKIGALTFLFASRALTFAKLILLNLVSYYSTYNVRRWPLPQSLSLLLIFLILIESECKDVRFV
ncbi:hypothetical protein Baya_11701 [Bagarius yarrelli]|uniref:Uncharacterized protein n=1 Tax=Bagarius yarrelli TaxID=175774 RepID=A0A556V1B2_BAGYA|nr:hypothetical protein Baya_11701 [Bagarius yarrelli]